MLVSETPDSESITDHIDVRNNDSLVLGELPSVTVNFELSVSMSGGEKGWSIVKLRDVPRFLVEAFSILRLSPKHELFRRSPNWARVNKFKDNFTRIFLCLERIPAEFNSHDVCHLIKKFFRSLKTPFFECQFVTSKLLKLGEKRLEGKAVTREEIQSVFRSADIDCQKKQFSCTHMATLAYLMRELKKISENSVVQMSPDSLAVCFTSNLLPENYDKLMSGARTSAAPQLHDIKTKTETANAAISALIENAYFLSIDYVSSNRRTMSVSAGESKIPCTTKKPVMDQKTVFQRSLHPAEQVARILPMRRSISKLIKFTSNNNHSNEFSRSENLASPSRYKPSVVKNKFTGFFTKTRRNSQEHSVTSTFQNRRKEHAPECSRDTTSTPCERNPRSRHRSNSARAHIKIDAIIESPMAPESNLQSAHSLHLLNIGADCANEMQTDQKYVKKKIRRRGITCEVKKEIVEYRHEIKQCSAQYYRRRHTEPVCILLRRRNSNIIIEKFKPRSMTLALNVQDKSKENMMEAKQQLRMALPSRARCGKRFDRRKEAAPINSSFSDAAAVPVNRKLSGVHAHRPAPMRLPEEKTEHKTESAFRIMQVSPNAASVKESGFYYEVPFFSSVTTHVSSSSIQSEQSKNASTKTVETNAPSVSSSYTAANCTTSFSSLHPTSSLEDVTEKFEHSNFLKHEDENKFLIPAEFTSTPKVAHPMHSQARIRIRPTVDAKLQARSRNAAATMSPPSLAPAKPTQTRLRSGDEFSSSIEMIQSPRAEDFSVVCSNDTRPSVAFLMDRRGFVHNRVQMFSKMKR